DGKDIPEMRGRVQMTLRPCAVSARRGERALRARLSASPVRHNRRCNRVARKANRHACGFPIPGRQATSSRYCRRSRAFAGFSFPLWAWSCGVSLLWPLLSTSDSNGWPHGRNNQQADTSSVAGCSHHKPEWLWKGEFRQQKISLMRNQISADEIRIIVFPVWCLDRFPGDGFNE